MSKPKYHTDLEQGSTAWLEARLGIITASQVCRLITKTGKLANSDDSRGIIFDKVSERITGRIEAMVNNHHMERGHIFEVIARDLYSEKIAQVSEVGFISRDYGSFVLAYSPDGLVGSDGLIEIKSPTRTKHVKEICLDTPPDAYMAQIQTGLLVTDRRYCDYISHYNGMKQRIVRVYPDEEYQAKILEAVGICEAAIQMHMTSYEEATKDMPMAPFIEEILVD